LFSARQSEEYLYMAWLDEAIDCLAARPVCGYTGEVAPAVEPTALAALALAAANRIEPTTAAVDWLVRVQSADGSLGINADFHEPCWPTGGAILALTTAAKTIPNARQEWLAAAKRATTWMLSVAGCPVEAKAPEYDNRAGSKGVQVFGHNAMLQGWPWVIGTHSWVEPTAMSVLALRSQNLADHPRYREAVQLLLDRQLPQGGWNYGNTIVLGSVLRPHVESTGLALAALAGEANIRPRVRRSLDWLSGVISERTTAASLAYAIWGLLEHGLRPEAAGDRLAVAGRRTLTHQDSPHRLALLVLAAKKVESHG
jgi:hypothetical protein